MKRLYYLTTEKWGLNNLEHQRLKFARFHKLNDPFELLSAHLGDTEARKFYKRLKKAVAERFGVLCFSDQWRSPVMWAHYGDKHKGLCLGFDVIAAKKVKYEPERLKEALQAMPPSVRLAASLIETAMTTKFGEWSYEREWRIFKDLDVKHSDGNYYQKFGDFIILREVIIGSCCALTPEQVACKITPTRQDVSIIKARQAFTKFEIIRQRQIREVVVRSQA